MNCSKVIKNDWEDATCSVCMECPHNAVLLLCSSHDKGCRPYMCGTSFHYSNCVNLYKKVYTKVALSNNPPHHASLGGEEIDPFSAWNYKTMELACPLCRGQVKGSTVVKPARAYLNAMKRTCIEDTCLFVGTYKELQKHVRAEHSSSEPPEINPNVEQKWRRMELDRDREDVMSVLRSSNPGAIIHGDYVVGGHDDYNSGNRGNLDSHGMGLNESIRTGIDMPVSHFFEAFDPAGNPVPLRDMTNLTGDGNRSLDGGFARSSHRSHTDSYQDGSDYGGTSLTKRLRRRGISILGRSQRRRRQRAMNGNGRHGS